MDHNALIQSALDCGAAGAAVVSVGDIAFDRAFRDACARNICGKYGTNWMCPPSVGDIDEMISRAKSFGQMLVFQSISLLEDSYDIEGMRAAGKNHSALTLAIALAVRPMLEQSIMLGAGACGICGRCAKADDAPCRFPEKAAASLESYGISVTDLASLSGLKYINGQNTLTFFGGILF